MREDVFLYHGIRAEAAFYRVAPWSGGGGGKMELEETPVSFHYNQLEYAPCVSLWRESALPCSMLTVAAGYETGADGEYIGAEGRYGLGRVMVCDEADREGRMTVLQW